MLKSWSANISYSLTSSVLYFLGQEGSTSSLESRVVLGSTSRRAHSAENAARKRASSRHKYFAKESIGAQKKILDSNPYISAEIKRKKDHYIRFEFLVLPFVLTNAPRIFINLTNEIFKDVLDVLFIVCVGDFLSSVTQGKNNWNKFLQY